MAYLQSNGQVEVDNREILWILRVWLDHVGGSWVDVLPGVLWAIRMTPKEGMCVTPFHLVYGGEAVIPVKVDIESDWLQQYNEDNIKRRQLELDLVDEARVKAATQLTAYRQRMRQSYNRRVIHPAFQVGDLRRKTDDNWNIHGVQTISSRTELGERVKIQKQRIAKSELNRRL
ncbi:uncharacterized protein LOC122050846 [Zingiber officinale]|uniref:uncharacterized protein LOC122050846 n=1 Tax=Zingiber officinale TaxID=94328 RepID=UPI001C4B9E3D|nr:uncharacterized protein LOC122050846 [Zingiber officinale]